LVMSARSSLLRLRNAADKLSVRQLVGEVVAEFRTIS
jgi:hypothetical protein